MSTPQLCASCFQAREPEQLVRHLGANMCRHCYRKAFGASPEELAEAQLEREATARERNAASQRAEEQLRSEKLRDHFASLHAAAPSGLIGIPEHVILTTAPTLEGFRILHVLDVISAECVYGQNLFRDFFASMTDVVGGRSTVSQSVLRDARITCATELRHEAVDRGANAVIGVDLDYSEISGGGKSMLMMVATGTAVFVERLARAEAVRAMPA